MLQLRRILLREDREAVREIKTTIDDPDQLAKKVAPIIEQRMAFFKESFPREFKVTVDTMIEDKLEASQEEILNVIYPVMGKMIKKYVNHQIQLLKDAIDERIRDTFSRRGVFWRLKNAVLGIKPSDQVFHDLRDYRLEELYVIQRHSGLLFGTASRGTTIDQDLVAGMLTAIKSFVEDAFKREREDLEMIQYGTYKILLQNFYSYYIAVAISGTMTNAERETLGDRLLNFAENQLHDLPAETDEETVQRVSLALREELLLFDPEKSL